MRECADLVMVGLVSWVAASAVLGWLWVRLKGGTFRANDPSEGDRND